MLFSESQQKRGAAQIPALAIQPGEEQQGGWIRVHRLATRHSGEHHQFLFHQRDAVQSFGSASKSRTQKHQVRQQVRGQPADPPL
uniref:Uncharacterized protein n=1 Tax=Gasterosteus aculeatus TaxID=69293 RepID=G3NRW3_GASAC